MSIELESMKYFQTEETQVDQEPSQTSGVAAETPGAQPALSQTPYRRQKPSARSGWTKGLTWICVFFALISFTGFCSACLGGVGLFMEPAKSDTTGMSYSVKQRVEKFEAAAAATREKYIFVLGYMEVMKLGLAIGFGVACFYLIIRHPRGRSMAVALCVLALLFHVGSVAVSMLVINNGGMLQDLMASSFDEAAAGQKISSSDKEMLQNSMTNAVFTGMLIALTVGLVIKFVFYGLIMMHLMQPEVKRIFGEDDLTKQNQALGLPATA